MADLPMWCEHPETIICWRVNRSGVGAWVRQCQVCGSQSGPAINKRSPEVMGRDDRLPFDEELGLRYEEIRRAQIQRQQIVREQEQARKQREWWDSYNTYLQTPQWKARRAQVLKRANGLCEGCRESRAVQVHHLTYEHVGNEFLFELVALCLECHDRIHQSEKVAV